MDNNNFLKSLSKNLINDVRIMLEGKKIDQDGDGDNDFDDVQIARYMAGGMSKKDAIAKAKAVKEKGVDEQVELDEVIRQHAGHNWSGKGLLSKMKNANKMSQLAKDAKEAGEEGKRHYANFTKAYTKEEVELTQEEIDNIEAILADLDEARGRPRKDLGYTINPNNKEKLYHDNPAHMATLEKLQAKGTIPKPAIEPSLHIINQLRKASTAMTPYTVTFRNGEKHPVLGTHASKILDKYASLKPSEKEAFQHKISGSHTAMKNEI